MKKRFREMGKNKYNPIEEKTVKFLSLRIARLLKNVKIITPNRISIFRLLLALLIAFLITKKELIISAVLVYFYFMLDKLDGDLARIRKTESNSGAFIDSIIDNYSFIMLTIAAALEAGVTNPIIISMAVTCPILFFYHYFGRTIHLDTDSKRVKRVMENSRLRTLFAFSYGKLYLLLIACLLLNILYYFLLVLALLQAYVILWVIVYVYRGVKNEKKALS